MCACLNVVSGDAAAAEQMGAISPRIPALDLDAAHKATRYASCRPRSCGPLFVISFPHNLC